ncbi:MAG: hypothetical protein RJQ08_10290 [Salinisphaeraceae bacterium]
MADLAAELRADYPGLKLPDTLHLVTAINAGCGAMVTGEKRPSVASARMPVLVLDQIEAG